jgi:hypothetical protein
MDQVLNEGAIYGARNGLGSNRRSDGSEGAIRSRSNRRSYGWYKRWIREQKKERWVVQAMYQGVIEGVMGGASDGSRSNRWSDGLCKLFIREQ